LLSDNNILTQHIYDCNYKKSEENEKSTMYLEIFTFKEQKKHEDANANSLIDNESAFFIKAAPSEEKITINRRICALF
jgi:hypothetical protein